MSYITRDQLLAMIAKGSMARLGTDADQLMLVGTGNAIVTTFTSPYTDVTTFKGYVDGVLVTPAPTVSRGTGTGGFDQAIFAAAPASGKTVHVSADAKAIAASLIDDIITDTQGIVDGYLARYTLPITNASALATIRPHFETMVKYRLRVRRDIPIPDGLQRLYDQAVSYFTAIQKGQDLPGLSTTDTTTYTGLPGSGALITAEDPVFGAPWSDPVSIP